jgi:hypothetical protein
MRPVGVHVNQFFAKLLRPKRNGWNGLGLVAESSTLAAMKAVEYKDSAGVVHSGHYTVAPQPAGYSPEARQVTVYYKGHSRSSYAGPEVEAIASLMLAEMVHQKVRRS